MSDESQKGFKLPLVRPSSGWLELSYFSQSIGSLCASIMCNYKRLYLNLGCSNIAYILRWRWGQRVLLGTRRNSWRSLVCCKMNEIVSYVILRKCNCCSVSQLRPFIRFLRYIERENDHLCCASLDRLFSSGRNNNAITISHQQTMDSHLSLSFLFASSFVLFHLHFRLLPDTNQPTARQQLGAGAKK